MDIIKTYLDNLFAGLPRTKEVLKMKADLLANMLDKYHELKNEGKSENEAVGIVISEFGNIEELAEELGVDITPNPNPPVTTDVARSYMQCCDKMGLLVAFGVMLCILSPIVLILLTSGFWDLGWSEAVRSFVGITVLLGIVAVAVGLFIYSGMKFAKYEYLKTDVPIPLGVREMVSKEKEAFDPKFIVALIVGIMLYIFSPALLIGASLISDGNHDDLSVLGVAVLLVITAIATFIIVRFGIIRGGHNVLLRLEDYARIGKKSDKLVSAISGVYWPLVVGAYLLWSFLGRAWGHSWIIFPIAGVVFASISALVRMLKKD
jgi:hypothetical protein